MRAVLGGPRTLGEVAAVFQRALYLRDIDGGMICVAHEKAHDAPLTIRAAIPRQFEFDKAGITIGMPVGRAAQGEVTIGGGLVLAMSDAVEWRPAEVVATTTAEQVLKGLRRVSFELGKGAPDIGFASLVSQVESLADEKTPRPLPGTGLLNAALPPIEQLVQSIRLRDSRGVDMAVKSLLGLGPGLTPSGDDFLCGFMVAGIATIKALGPDGIPSREFEVALSDVAESVSLHAASMTTDVSASFLKYATQGIASSAVHKLIEDLLVVSEQGEIISAASALTEVGHSSGWDCLLGTLLGMHLCLGLHTGGRTVAELESHGRLKQR